MKPRGWILLASALVAVFAIKGIVSANGPDDRTLIKRALAEAQKASREGRPGGVMEVLSEHIKINDQTVGSTGKIAQWIKDGHPDVQVTTVDPMVEGDRATIVSPISVSVDMPIVGHYAHDFSSVTLVFQKEDDRDWFVFPIKKWKLVDAIVPASEVPGGLEN